MKTRFLIFIACMLLIVTNGFAKARKIEGNGKLITKEISIQDYDAISGLGGAVIEYEQSSDKPYLRVTVDENILPLLDIRVKGKTLRIDYKTDDEYDKKVSIDGNNIKIGNDFSLSPTKYVITTNSRSLKEISLVAGCRININSDFKAERMDASIAGSGNIDFKKSTDLYKGSFRVAGSGDIYLRKFKSTNLNCSVAGSGEITLNGKAERGNYSVAGGGDIYGYKCELKKAECNVAGGGNIQVYATERLEANIAAGGKISYKGDPQVTQNTIAGGSITKEAE